MLGVNDVTEDTSVTFKSCWQGEFKRLNGTIAGEDGELVIEGIVIKGVDVTGRAESLKQL
ncbi:hypothetical protein [Lysinibacillus sp. RC79]|uniref:hypothetical protein n=1 Tax=Lysinibacillus sp. RC79 TaxID=3156296 RepID=UPI003513C793